MHATTLTRVRLFSGVDWPGTGPDLAGCEIRHLRDAEVLSRPDDARDRVWLVLSGALLVRIAPHPDPVWRAGAGDTVGAWDVVELDRRARWVLADGPTEVVEVPLSVLDRLLGQHAALRANLWRELVRRVRHLESELAGVRVELDTSRRKAHRDGLTGLFNRRWLDEQLQRMLSQRADGARLSLVMVDVDHFKRLNDTLGHDTGDVVLVAVSQSLRRRFRPSDLVARYGGEEFAVLMPATDLASAMSAAERVRRAVEYTRFAAPDGTPLPPITVSCGVAEAAPDDDAGSLVRRADQALYAAKATGRNCVVEG